MIREIATAAAASLALLASGCAARLEAADLGAPPRSTRLPVVVPDPHPLAGCFVEGSGAGTFLAAGDRVASLGIGAGCQASLGALILGGIVRGNVGSLKAGSFAATMGIQVNPHVQLYGLTEWRTPDWALASTGQLYIGAGAETTISTPVTKDQLSAFVEGSTAIAKIGPSTPVSDIEVRVGLRFRPFK